MEVLPSNVHSPIMHLPDDCLVFIYKRLDNHWDRESFGLTCHRWLHIQNISCQSLQFECSFTHLNISSLYHATLDVETSHLYRLLIRYQHLETLSLSGCTNLKDSGLTQLQYYGPSLQNLHLDCCFSVTDYGLSLVASGCPSLMVVSLYRCQRVTDLGLEYLARGCSALKDVNLSYCSQISDKGLGALTQRCHQLRAVKMSHCDGITGVGFAGCSQSLVYVEAESCNLDSEGMMGIVGGGGIEYLNVSGLSFSRDPLAAIGLGSASNLRILNLRMCRCICEESVIAIVKGCPLLYEWNLALCHGVKLSGWESIGSNCCNLAKLHVNRCRNLCDRGLQALRDGCKHLSILYINGCCRITSTAMELFKCYRGDVQIKEEEVMCMGPKWAF